MKKITKFFFLLIALAASGSVAKAVESAYCQTVVKHFNIAGETASAIKLTISKIDATSMYVEIESNTADPVDLLIVNNGSGATISAPDNSVSGKIRRTLTWTTAPANVSIELLWSKVTMGGNWMLNTFSVPFDATCGGGTPDAEAPTAFTATKGKELSTSVELLLNATDNSGSVTYSITYGGTTVTTTGTSATQKSYSVTGLTPSTAYAFSVSAKDAANNVAANNPIVVNATTTAGLTTSPATPTYAASKVISIFSDAYTNVANINYNPNWGQATQQSIIQVGANNVMRYANFNYQGTQFDHVFPVATGMKYLHLDIWTETETKVDVFPICWNGSGNEAEKFKTVTIGSSDQGSWKSVDIPLSDFTSQGLTMVDVYQLKLVGSGGKTVYFDNIYFYDNTVVADTEAPTAFTATKGTVSADQVELLLNATDNSGAVVYTISYGSGPTVLTTSGLSGVEKSYMVSGLSGGTAYAFSVTAKDAANNQASNNPVVVNATTLSGIPAAPTPTIDASRVMSVYSDAYTNLPTTHQNWYGNTFTPSTLGGNAAMKNVSICCFGYEFTAKPINVSSMTKLHVDIYPTTLASMSLGITDGGDRMKTGITLTANQWNAIDLPLSELTGANLANVNQIGFWNLNGTFYYDNLYFYNDTSTSLNSLSDENGINIYPNPANSSLTVSAQSEIKTISIMNLVGQTVQILQVGAVERSIDLSSLSNGQYIMALSMKNGQRVNQKFIKY
jgi:hypothetical protein